MSNLAMTPFVYERPGVDPEKRRAQELLDERNQVIHDLREELRQERAKVAAMEQGILAVRELLTPFYRGLRLVFGEIDALGVADAQSAVPSRVQAVWDDWKRKLPSGEAKAIDALLLHGRLKTDQIRIHVGCASRTAQNIVAALKSKGLVVKDGAYFSLKEL